MDRVSSEDLLNRAVSRSVAESIDMWRALSLVQLDLLDVVALPPELLPEIEVAGKYWRDGIGSPDDTLAARVRVWEVVHRAEANGDRYVEYRGRQVVGVLFAAPLGDTPERVQHEIYDWVEWFVEFDHLAGFASPS